MSVVLDAPLELLPTSTPEEKQTLISAVYKQVLGNPHVMDSERLGTEESQLCNASLSVREFVRAVAKSSFYRRRYFESCAPYRFVELNFKHLLGRAPLDQAELSKHILGRISPSKDATEKMFKILVKGSKFDSPRRRSNTVYLVSGADMTPQIQRIHRVGGTIVSITEVV
jgi:hypothetical protein